MRFLCLSYHENLPLCLVEIQRRRPRPDMPRKDGFVVFHSVEVHPGNEAGAEMVIDRLDVELRPHLQAHGVYRCRAAVLRDAYERVIRSAVPANRWSTAIRWGAALLALFLVVAQTALGVAILLPWMVVSAFRRQSGAQAMFDTFVLFSVFDFRKTIRRLYAIWQSK